MRHQRKPLARSTNLRSLKFLGAHSVQFVAHGLQTAAPDRARSQDRAVHLRHRRRPRLCGRSVVATLGSAGASSKDNGVGSQRPPRAPCVCAEDLSAQVFLRGLPPACTEKAARPPQRLPPDFMASVAGCTDVEPGLARVAPARLPAWSCRTAQPFRIGQRVRALCACCQAGAAAGAGRGVGKPAGTVLATRSGAAALLAIGVSAAGHANSAAPVARSWPANSLPA